MVRSGAFFGIIVAVLAMLYPAGAATAALTCAVPQMSANAPMEPDCDGDQKVHDCALHCAPMCAAVTVPAPEASSSDVPGSPRLVWANELLARPKRTGPEPPPPRAR